jgi:hypothetical protein
VSFGSTGEESAEQRKNSMISGNNPTSYSWCKQAISPAIAKTDIVGENAIFSPTVLG